MVWENIIYSHNCSRNRRLGLESLAKNPQALLKESFRLFFYRKTIGNSWKKLSNRLSASSAVSAMSSNMHSFNKEDSEKIEGSVEENPDSPSHVSYT